MRRILNLAGRSTLAIGLLLGWIWVFHSAVTPPPKFSVPTGAVYESEPLALRPQTKWASVQMVSTDGERVLIGVHQGGFRHTTTRLELWNARNGTNSIPAWSQDAEWQEIFSVYLWKDTGLLALTSQPDGIELLFDETAWEKIRDRFATRRAKAIDDLCKTVRPIGEKEFPRVFPESIYFSPDGRLIAYVSRNGWPVYLVSETLGDGTMVEDARTGQLLALLPGTTHGLSIAPGGQTATSSSYLGEGDQRLLLWDLRTSALRATLSLPGSSFRSGFSPDGRYLFASCVDWEKPIHRLKWWESATGREVGHVVNAWDTAIIGGGKVLVTKPQPPRKAAVSESYLLCFWDMASGAQLGEWDLGAASDGGGLIEQLVGSDSDRYLAGVFDPDYGRGRGPALRAADRVASYWSDEPVETKQVVVWDVVDRREATRLPGRSAAFSPDGHWLATIDRAGVVRVWAVPVHRPWVAILVYGGIAALLSWCGVFALDRLARQLLRTRVASQIERVIWVDRKQRWRTAAGLMCLILTTGVGVWHSCAATRAREHMLAAYEEVNVRMGEGMAEADVTALVGRPADEEPVTEITGRKKGGGQFGIPTELRKWTWYGTELDVYIAEDGSVRAAYISDPLGYLDQVAIWLGI